jgi:hypothetical protein
MEAQSLRKKDGKKEMGDFPSLKKNIKRCIIGNWMIPKTQN